MWARLGLALALGIATVGAGPSQSPERSPDVVFVWDVRPDAGPADQASLARGLVDSLSDQLVAVHYLVTDGRAEPVPPEALHTRLASLRGSGNVASQRVTLSEAVAISRKEESIRDAVLARECQGARPAGDCDNEVRAHVQGAIDDLQQETVERLRAIPRLVRALEPAPHAIVIVTSGWAYRARPSTPLDDLTRLAAKRNVPVFIARLAALEGRRAGLSDAAEAPPAPLRRVAPKTREGDDPAALAARLVESLRSVSPAAAARDSTAPESSTTPPDLQRKATAYVGRFLDSMRVVIARERYEQEVRWRPTSISPGAPGLSVLKERRALDSEVAMVQVASGESWVMNRRILAIDGRAVARSTASPVAAAASVDEAIAQLQAEARRGESGNIGGIHRDINIPTLALWFLTRSVVARFVFHVDATPDAITSGTQVLRFDERQQPALLHVNGQRVPSRGRFWIDRASGAVIRSELVLEQRGVASALPIEGGSKATIDVRYAYSDKLGFHVPERMTEFYQSPVRGRLEMVSAVAHYSDYRRFDVAVRIK